MAYTNPVTNGVVARDEIIDGTTSGTQVIENGGLTENCTVVESGRQNIMTGGVSSKTVMSGGSSTAIRPEIFVMGGLLQDVTCYNTTLIRLESGEIKQGKLYGKGFLQTATGKISDIFVYDNSRIELSGNSTASNITVDASGIDTEIGKTNVGAQLIIFDNYNNGQQIASNVILQNGGSAHVYDGGRINNVTVKNGGVLYMTDWAFDTGIDWMGKPRPQTGTVVGGTIESGGTLWIGGSAATVQNVKVMYGADVRGFKTSQNINITVYDSAGKGTTIVLRGSGTALKGLVLDPDSPLKELGGNGRGGIVNGVLEPKATLLTDLTIKEGAILYDVSYASNITGKYVFKNGSSQSFKMTTGGLVSGYVLASGMSLLGDLQGTAVAKTGAQLTDVKILEGGILDGFRTGRGGDSTKLSTGTYVGADGKVMEWSFGKGTATNMVINSGCFVIQGYDPDTQNTGGVAANTTVNGGILVMGNGAAANGLTVSDHTALQVYGSGTITNGVNLDTGSAFSIVDGVADGLLIENGGFYGGGAGQTIQNSVITGSREFASGNNTRKQSYMELSNGAIANNVTLSDGAMLILKGAFTLNNVKMDDSVTVVWANFDPNCVLIDTTVKGYEDLIWDAEAMTLTNWVQYGNGDTAFNFKPQSMDKVKYVNLTLKDLAYNTLELGTDVYIDGVVFDMDGRVPGVAAGSGGWTNTWAGTWSLGKNSVVKNLKVYGGDLGITFDVDGVVLDNKYAAEGLDCYLLLDGCTASNVTVENSVLHIGSNATQWSTEPKYSIVNNLTLNGGRANLRCGTINGLTANGGSINFEGNTDTYNKATFELAGDFYLSNVTLTFSNNQVKLDMAKMSSLTLAGNTIIQNDIVGGKDKTLTIRGTDNQVSDAYTVNVGTILFEQTDNWFSTRNITAWLKNMTATEGIIFRSRLGQGDYSFGDLGTTENSFTAAFNFELSGEKFSLKFGETKVINGYEVKLYEEYLEEWKVYTGHLSVRAVNSSNTLLGWDELEWADSKKYAIKYTNDLAATTSGEINLGDKMEGDGGNAVYDAFGTISAAGIVNANQKSTTVFGGASNKEIATTWVKVMATGNAGMVVYGGGNGKDVTDGTNLYVGGATTSAYLLFGAGRNSTVSVGENNVYAVNMEVATGYFYAVYGGGNNAVINGDINLYLHNCSVGSLISGAGASDVNGNVNMRLDLPAYKNGDKTIYAGGIIYGGATSTVTGGVTTPRNSTITGDVNLSLLSSADNVGRYEGMIYGGSRGAGALASITGDINLVISNIEHTNNPALIASGKGNSAWVIAGSNAVGDPANKSVAGGATVGGSVNLTVSNSKLVNVIGGGQAEDGSVITVGGVNLSFSEVEVSGSVYGGGYTKNNGEIVINGDNVLTLSSGTSINGYVYASGYTVKDSGQVTVNGNTIVRLTGDGDLFSVGTIDGLGKGNCSVLGNTIAEFKDFSGEFGGQLLNFTVAKFSGNTKDASLTDTYTCSNWQFDVRGRTELDMMVSNPDSFKLEGDDREIGLTIDAGSSFNFDLMDVSDENLDGVNVVLYDEKGVSIGEFAIGETFKYQNGTLTLDVDDTGVLFVKYDKGTLA